MTESSPLNFWTILYAVAAAQGYFLTVVLFSIKRGNRAANRCLALLMLLFSYYLTDIFMGSAKLFYQWPHLLHVATPLWYLFPPLSYFYLRYLLGPPVRWRLWHLFHLLPFFIFLDWLLPFYPLSAEIKIKFWTGVYKPPGGSLVIFLYLMINPLQGILYFSNNLRLIRIRKTAVSLNGKQGAASPAYLSWLRLFFSLMLVYSVILLTALSLHFAAGIWYNFFDKIALALFAFILFAVAYLAIVQPERLFPVNLLPRKIRNGPAADTALVKHQARALIQLMESEKPYLNSELKYSDLAARLGISARLLTEVLNREIGQSFNDFVNIYRVREVQQRLSEGENNAYTLLSIALDSGFNSKASFNRAFKKHAGVNPSQYLSAHRMEHSSF